MGTRWRPGRKGTRTRMWDFRQEKQRRINGKGSGVFPWKPYWPQSWLPAQRPVPRKGRKRARAEAEAWQPVPKR